MYSTWTNSTMALYIPCTASAPITSGLQAECQLLHFSALKNEDNNKREKRQKLSTRSCDNDHSMCMGHCGSQSGETRERKREKKKREINPLLNQDGIDYLQTKHSHICFKLFFAVSACARWPGSACSLKVELQTVLQWPVSIQSGG